MSKTLSQPIVQNEQQGVELNQNLADEQMVQQSMRALENQKMYEQENDYDVSVMQPIDTSTYDSQLVTDDMQQSSGQSISNTFANIFHKLAVVFGTDNAIGAKCEEWAKEIEKSSVTDEEAAQIQQDTLDETSVNGISSNIDMNVESEPVGAIIDSKSEAISNNNMRVMAQEVSAEDGFIKAATAQNSEFTQLDSKMDSMMYILSENTMGSLAGVDVTGEDKSKVAGSYMTMMHGLQEFNNSAIDEINTKYADDETKREKAMTGLGKIMNRAVMPAMANTAIDDSLYGFLSESDKQELDSMAFTGVDKTYGDVVAERTPEKAKENDVIFANVDSYENIGKSVVLMNDSQNNGSQQSFGRYGQSLQFSTRDYGSLTNDSMPTRSGRGDRAAQAESTFSNVLANDKAARENSFTNGLER